ncbi:MAG: hypothetical protein ACRYFS_21965 [Janthinobacterium lividum]
MLKFDCDSVLPPLNGTFRDILCAETIRRDRMEKAVEAQNIGFLTAQTEAALRRRFGVMDARWWLATQNTTLGQFASMTMPRKRM